MSAPPWIEITANGVWPAPSLCGGVEGPGRRAPNPEEVALSREWLVLFAVPTKTIRARRSSYGYKHDRGPVRDVVVRLSDGRQKLSCGHWFTRGVNRRRERRCLQCLRDRATA